MRLELMGRAKVKFFKVLDLIEICGEPGPGNKFTKRVSDFNGSSDAKGLFPLAF